MRSPSRNVQYHPPRLSEDRLNLPQPHSPSLPTHCSGKSGMRPCHDRLARTGRARDARRAAVLPFDKLPLGWMQEDRPLLPGEIQRPLQRLHVRHYPEAALRVRMRERIGARDGRRGPVRRAAGRKLQQRLGCLRRQVIREVEQSVLRRRPHVAQPLGRHAMAQQVVVRRVPENRHPRRHGSASRRALAGRRDIHLHIPRHPNLTHRLADLDELRRPRRGMPFHSPTLGPLIRRVVMVHVAEQEARRGPVHDQPDVATDPNRPEVLVLRPIDLMQLQPRMRRVHLQVERRGLDCLLLVAGQPGEAVGEGIGDAELHQVCISTGTPIWFATDDEVPTSSVRPVGHVSAGCYVALADSLSAMVWRSFSITRMSASRTRERS